MFLSCQLIMAARASSSRRTTNLKHSSLAPSLIILSILLLSWASHATAAASFGFSIHHRFSDPVKSILAGGVGDEFVPEKDTADYFTVLAARDFVHGRRLLSTSSSNDNLPLTFVAGNTTYRLNSFGFLYYANVSVGTPALDFMVALDTGSDRFWLPCDCVSCVTAIQVGDDSTSQEEIKLNIYNLNTSSSGTKVPCSSSMCEHKSSCLVDNRCPYEVRYLSENTSSTGYLVQDVLHLATDTQPSKPMNANITFGCGQSQQGSFLDGGAPNGLFGLGMDKSSVPSILASQHLTANSFSLCFARGGIGRISFGDTGSSKQSKTPLSLDSTHATYNVSITQVSVEKKETSVDDSAIFDSGTSFTILKDPIYSFVTENFNSQVKDKRVQLPDSSVPFKYCYSMSSCQNDAELPVINLTFGGVQFSVLHPAIFVAGKSECYYCLAVLKNNLINIIGQNFMTGYRMVFNRDKMELGWQPSDCNYEFNSDTIGMSPEGSPTISSNLNPEATPAASNGKSDSGGSLSISDHIKGHLILLICVLVFTIHAGF